jgi:hypothetical protein
VREAHTRHRSLWLDRNATLGSRLFRRRIVLARPLRWRLVMTRTIVPMLFALLASACAPFALSPPTQLVPLHTVETVRLGHVAVRAGGGAHSWGSGSAVASGSGGVSVGVAPDVEVQADGMGAWLGGLETRAVTPVVGAGRIGVQHRVEDWLAFSGGAGAGAGPWGAFAGTDLGMILAYENPYLVPFFAARMQLSVPIDPRPETVTNTNGSMTTTMMIAPGATMWFQPSTGVRIPFCRDAGCDGVRVSRILAGAWTTGFGLDSGNAWGSLGGEGALVLEL